MQGWESSREQTQTSGPKYISFEIYKMNLGNKLDMNWFLKTIASNILDLECINIIFYMNFEVKLWKRQTVIRLRISLNIF